MCDFFDNGGKSFVRIKLRETPYLQNSDGFTEKRGEAPPFQTNSSIFIKAYEKVVIIHNI